MYGWSAYGVALRDATRPRSSGVARNVHFVRENRELPPDFEKMRLQIQGENQSRVEDEKKSVKPD